MVGFAWLISSAFAFSPKEAKHSSPPSSPSASSLPSSAFPLPSSPGALFPSLPPPSADFVHHFVSSVYDQSYSNAPLKLLSGGDGHGAEATVDGTSSTSGGSPGEFGPCKMNSGGNLVNLISESYKFIRMADDLHDVASYLNEMRICFLLLTGTVYLILAIYFVSWCVRRNRRQVNGGGSANRPRGANHRWDLQGDEYQNAVNAQTNIGQTSDDLVSVRSDGALPGAKGGAPAGIGTAAPQFGMSTRAGAARQTPSFMRHSGTGGGMAMQNHSGGINASAATLQLGPTSTTRLIADSAGNVTTKQQPTNGPPHHQHMANLAPAQHQHHHMATAHQHQIHTTNNGGAEQQQAHQMAQGKPTEKGSATTSACLLNNISEDHRHTHTMPTTGIPTFGVRSRERVLLERHELQPNNGAGGAEL
ncbi:hypothetical protein niasHS_002423 [Heterodera schachtii]|uniref:Uncharacterized protein n=1 Tax=Heterodera schachtii TaxID=97005 RepID=A0ABD2KJW9_HETSC